MQSTAFLADKNASVNDPLLCHWRKWRRIFWRQMLTLRHDCDVTRIFVSWWRHRRRGQFARLARRDVGAAWRRLQRHSCVGFFACLNFILFFFSLAKTMDNWIPRIRNLWWKLLILRYHRCLIFRRDKRNKNIQKNIILAVGYFALAVLWRSYLT